MIDAPLYQNANAVQRQDAQKVLKEFRDVIQWRPDGRDTLVDIGCGSGDVTMDFILPIMPKSFSQLVGVDISEKMIQYSNDRYKVPRVDFEVMDIGADLKDGFKERFDHVMSFYCLHWVQNQKKALSNIYDLLTVEGDCLLVFLAENAVYEAYKRLSRKKEWAPYMQDVNDFITPYQNSKDPSAEFTELLRASGFSESTVEIREEVFTYEGTENLKRNVKAISPFVPRMSPLEQDAFLEDYVQVIDDLHLREKTPEGTDYRYISPYKLIVAYARK